MSDTNPAGVVEKFDEMLQSVDDEQTLEQLELSIGCRRNDLERQETAAKVAEAVDAASLRLIERAEENALDDEHVARLAEEWDAKLKALQDRVDDLIVAMNAILISLWNSRFPEHAVSAEAELFKRVPFGSGSPFGGGTAASYETRTQMDVDYRTGSLFPRRPRRNASLHCFTYRGGPDPLVLKLQVMFVPPKKLHRHAFISLTDSLGVSPGMEDFYYGFNIDHAVSDANRRTLTDFVGIYEGFLARATLE